MSTPRDSDEQPFGRQFLRECLTQRVMFALAVPTPPVAPQPVTFEEIQKAFEQAKAEAEEG